MEVFCHCIVHQITKCTSICSSVNTNHMIWSIAINMCNLLTAIVIISHWLHKYVYTILGPRLLIIWDLKSFIHIEINEIVYSGPCVVRRPILQAWGGLSWGAERGRSHKISRSHNRGSYNAGTTVLWYRPELQTWYIKTNSL